MSGFVPLFVIHILPRESMSWEEFLKNTPPRSIALDGVVRGGPNFDPETCHLNSDHHDGVIREVTMSTAMQIYFAIKGGLFKAFVVNGKGLIHIYINDTDQDTSFAVWLLINYKMFEGTQSTPIINRLLALNDRWDITGGAFPMNLDDHLVRNHNWIFRPYTNLRKSGLLARATEDMLRDNLDAILKRLDLYLMGQAGEEELDTRREILYDSPVYKIVDEIGGNEARYLLFSQGMDAFVSLVARRDDGRFVYSIGRRSRYIVQFPVPSLYDVLNEAEGLTRTNGWNGSDIVGGSSRLSGSGLTWQQIRDLFNDHLRSLNILV